MVKDLPAKVGDAGDKCWILGQEDPLEEGMATHSSILAWKIPWTEEPSSLWSMGSPRVGHNLVTKQQQQFTKKVIVVQLLSRV